MNPGRFSHQGGLRFAPNSEPNSSVRKEKKEEKKETMQVQTTAVDTLEDIQPRCDPALQPTSRPSASFHVALHGSSQRRKRRRRCLMHPSASSPSVSVSAPSFICLISPRLPQHSLRWHPVSPGFRHPFILPQFPFSIYIPFRGGTILALRGRHSLFFSLLSPPLCAFFFFLIL